MFFLELVTKSSNQVVKIFWVDFFSHVFHPKKQNCTAPFSAKNIPQNLQSKYFERLLTTWIRVSPVDFARLNCTSLKHTLSLYLRSASEYVYNACCFSFGSWPASKATYHRFLEVYLILAIWLAMFWWKVGSFRFTFKTKLNNEESAGKWNFENY